MMRTTQVASALLLGTVVALLLVSPGAAQTPSELSNAAQVWGGDFEGAIPYDRFGICTTSRLVDDSKNAIYSLPYSCENVLPPSAWQQGTKAADIFDPVFDLAIVGAGIGGAALINRAVGGGSIGQPSLFPASQVGPPSVAIFEKASQVGGRLMSASGTGGLGLAVVPLDPDLRSVGHLSHTSPLSF